MNLTKPQGVSPKELRSFGLTIGGIFMVVGFWPLVVRSHSPWVWALSVAGIILGLAVFVPGSLGPIYRAWMRIGATLGWVNTRVILSLGYYVVFTPMGWIMRVAGRDPMRRKFDPGTFTYRVTKSTRPGGHMQRQF